MARARLHIICGNCGCNDEFEYRIVKDGHDNGETQTPAVFISCNNCGTLHDLSDTIKEKDSDCFTQQSHTLCLISDEPIEKKNNE